MDNEIELLKYVKCNKKIVIYGAGAVSRNLVRYLLENNVDKTDITIVVTDKQNDVGKLCGIPIQWIEEINTHITNFPVIIAVMGDRKYQMYEIAKKIFQFDIIMLEDDLCLWLRHRQGDFGYEINQIKSSIVRLTPQPRLSYLVLNIVEHCNLNCAGCDHFSPIANEKVISYKTIADDVERFAAIMKNEVDKIGIMGGEPLLHPQLLDIIKVTRDNFPESRIQLDTNGILLLQQTENFWKICRENKIIIVVTKYPINVDLDKISKTAQQNNVRFEFYGNSGEIEKHLYKICMDIDGNQDPRKSFADCFHANNCVTLVEGKLYTCTILPNVHIFNEKFNTNMRLTSKDYIDIYSERLTQSDILEFLAKPIPFCRYCDIKQRGKGYKWHISERKMTEWS